MSEKREFVFDLGNSTVGPIGMMAYVQAEDREEAVAKLRNALPDWLDVDGGDINEPDDVDITVFFNMEAVTAVDAEEEDDED